VSILLVASILAVARYDTVQVSAVRRQDSLRVVRGGAAAEDYAGSGVRQRQSSSKLSTSKSRSQTLKQVLKASR
jgi:hypothetical protein